VTAIRRMADLTAQYGKKRRQQKGQSLDWPPWFRSQGFIPAQI
jgi:hypothetical protein